MKAYINKRMLNWLHERIPPSARHSLSSKNVFIFPSGFGFSYLTMVLVIFLLGTNYQNNIILMFSFLLASLFITVMLFSFQNLNGMSIKLVKAPTGFANQVSYLMVELSGQNTRQFIHFHVEPNKQHSFMLTSANLNENIVKVQVPIPNARRGVLLLSRLRVSSTFPLGLFNTWTRLDLGCEHTVYPEPKLPMLWQQRQYQQDLVEHGQVNMPNQMGDFYQLENYQVGQSLSLVAWKQLAKSQQWLSKGHASAVAGDVWLDFQQMSAPDLEAKLSQLCALVIEYSQLEQPFGLKLPHLEIEPSSGEKHQMTCLQALARM